MLALVLWAGLSPVPPLHQYPDALQVAEARRLFFRDHGLGEDGGYRKRFFWLGWKWLRVPVPNTAGRVRAVRLHDFHHIATEYRTTWFGEAEIGAWELAGGCGRYAAAWVLNLYAFGVGLVIAPRALWRAFLCGRRSRNLYHRGLPDEDLRQPLGSLRALLGLPCPPARPTLSDVAAFAEIGFATLVLYAITGGIAAGLAAAAFGAVGGFAP